ncbi:NUDIX domain-containing protein [Patescibacteria group bacterium]|nr:NUDIX domain-containing protein [Patescibacteria group bacterium]MBU4023316.1 NUDIX domain-containing protein [Patescibacteria group bacterium]MBU4078391.1 NUDIX domain-containing protein [Patescibacteria group bacterium]
MVNKYVEIILKDDQGRILFQLRDERPKRYPNFWAFFGGGVDDGETPEETLHREIAEELGIENLKNYKLFKIYKLKDDKGNYEEHYVFIIHIKGIVPDMKLKLREGRGMAFLSFEEVMHMQFVEDYRFILKDLFYSSN